MTSNAALPALQRLFDAINAGRLDAIGELVTDDFVDHSSPVPLPPGPVGYAQVLGFVIRVLNVSYEVIEIICTEDRIVVRAVGDGVSVTPVHGPAVAGRPYSMDAGAACTGPRATGWRSTGGCGTSSAS